MKTKVQQQFGFSLIEALIVAIIIGILGAVGLPQLQNLMSAQIASVKSDSVTNAFRLARAEALSRVRTVSVEWNPGTSAIDRTGFSIQPGHIAVYDTADPDEQLVQQFSYLDDSVMVNTTDNAIRTFTPQGRVNQTVSFVFCKRDGDTEDSYRINVLVSGQVTSSRNVASCNP